MSWLTLLKLGAATKEAGKAYALLVIHTPAKDQPVTSETFQFALDRKKFRQARRREGSYLLRSNVKSDDPGHLWRLYLEACRNDRMAPLVTIDEAIAAVLGYHITRFERAKAPIAAK